MSKKEPQRDLEGGNEQDLPLDEDGKLDLSKHPGFFPMKEEDRLKDGEAIAIFIPSRGKHKKRPKD